MDSQKCYCLLGLDEGASMQEIKTAYRRLALRYHPDKNMSKQDGEKFKMITDAYRLLRSDYCFPHPNPQAGNNKRRHDNLGSKIPYWNELDLDRFFKEWFVYSRHAEKACRDFCKYEQESWGHFEKVMHHATSKVLSSVMARYASGHIFKTLCGRNPVLKKELQNVLSRFKF